MTVEGNDVEFLAEELDFIEPDDPFGPYEVLVYRAAAKATVRVKFEYQGDDPIDTSTLKINGVAASDGRFKEELDLTDPQKDRVLAGWYTVNATATRTLENGDKEEYHIENTFLAKITVVKTLDVELHNSGVPWITTLRRKPRILYDVEAGRHVITSETEDWGPADVSVESIGSLSATLESEQTDDSGRVKLAVVADTMKHGGGDSGWITGTFRVRAEKGGCVFQKDDSLSIPFAVVTGVNNVSTLFDGPNGPELGDPLYVGSVLKAGTQIQVGSGGGAAGSIGIRFANGQHVVLAAEMFQSFKAVINGPDDIQQGNTLMTMIVKNTLLAAQSDPRRMGRMYIYSKLGDALNDVLMVPDAVGYVSETPGGALEKYLAEVLEPKPIVGPKPKSVSALGSSAARSAQSISTLSEEDGETPPAAIATRSEMEFFTDGSILATQVGGGVLRITGPQGSRDILPGASVRIRDGSPRAPFTTVPQSQAPSPGALTFEPTPGGVVHTRRPEIALTVPNAEAVVWETLSVRLDGREVGGKFGEQGLGRTSWDPPVNEALRNGSHTIAATIQSIGGALLEGSVSFTVAAPPLTARDVRAYPCAEGVWLAWTRPQSPWPEVYEVWRRPEAGEPDEKLAGPLSQPWFLDEAPLASASYIVRAVDPDDSTYADASPVSTTWTADIAPAPQPVPVAPPVLSSEEGGVRIAFRNTSGAFGRFRIERAAQPWDAWESVAPGEWSVTESFLDTSAEPGANYAYRVVSVGLDGQTEEASDPAEVTHATTPPRVNGLRTAWRTGSPGGVVVRWNPVTSPSAAALRVERDTGTGFAPIATLATAAVEFLDQEVDPGTVAFYRVIATTDDETDGPPSVAGVAAVHPSVTEPTLVYGAAAVVQVPEGDGKATVELRRSNNLSEPATVGFLAENWDGSAQADRDFEGISGWAEFEPGQTSVFVDVPVLADDEVEVDETFGFGLFNVFASTEASDSADFPKITIKDQDQIGFENPWAGLRASEAGGSVALTIERYEASSRAVSVQVGVDGDSSTAVPGVDYAPFAPTTVNFAPGQTKATVTIPILNDAVRDGPKALTLALQSAAGGCGILDYSRSFAISLRDDETHTGQAAFVSSAQPIMVSQGGTQAVLPLLRSGGSDGALPVMAWVEGGGIPRDAVSITSPDPFVEGQTTAEVQVTVDPSKFAPDRAPFLILNLMNNEEPYNSSQAVVIFPREIQENGFADWVATSGVPSETTPLDDFDGDGVPALIEFAMGTSEKTGSSRPQMNFVRDEWGNFGGNVWMRYDPNLVFYAEFFENLNGPPTQIKAGNEQETDENGALLNFNAYLNGRSAFVRMRAIWLGNL